MRATRRRLSQGRPLTRCLPVTHVLLLDTLMKSPSCKGIAITGKLPLNERPRTVRQPGPPTLGDEMKASPFPAGNPSARIPGSPALCSRCLRRGTFNKPHVPSPPPAREGSGRPSAPGGSGGRFGLLKALELGVVSKYKQRCRSSHG